MTVQLKDFVHAW